MIGAESGNVYFTQGTQYEQTLIEDLIIEAISIYGHKMFYIPRTLVAKDNILGEDRLSEFKTAYPVVMYFENIDSFGGQGAMIQKFGLMVEQSATLTVPRRKWKQFVGRYGTTVIPDRPNEGDLVYFPLSKGLFEIKFVQHQDPFYQLGKLYVYKLEIELFQYASEKLDTGKSEVDIFETLKTHSTDITRTRYSYIRELKVTNGGSGYTAPPDVIIESTIGTGMEATAVLGTGSNSDKVVRIDITNYGYNYFELPTISFISPYGIGAEAIAIGDINIDAVESFGDNIAFQNEASNIVFNNSNPFGDP